MRAKLFIFSGLPATGKSTLAKLLAKETNSVYLRIDTIEQAIRELCSFNVQGEGYRLSYRIAEENLKLGKNVVSDSCNPWQLTRNEWEEVATKSGADFINIEVICSNIKEHKNRILTRNNEVEGLKLPTWEQIKNRDYHLWKKKVLKIDTANKTVEKSFYELLKKISNKIK
jgi:predicted kinase